MRRLARSTAARDQERRFVLEGPKLVVAALDAGAEIEGVYYARPGGRPNGAGPGAGPGAGLPGVPQELGAAIATMLERVAVTGARSHELSGEVMAGLSTTVASQGVIAVAPFVDVPLAELAAASFVLVLVGVRDPGNAGSLLRSAEAAGADGAIFCGSSVDPYNPKTVRASAGSLFHVRFARMGPPLEVLEELGSWGFTRIASVVEGGTDYLASDFERRFALVVGNEGTGLAAELLGACDQEISIPMPGRSESLNVAMAGTVMCFEAARQRRVVASRPAELLGA
ncbi:MAG: TrmH family RNA methyltransferase [Acidimicrobiales bacterium]